jgi:hypothetical protein
LTEIIKFEKSRPIGFLGIKSFYSIESKAEHTVDTLSTKWSLGPEETILIIKKFCDIGFFEEKGVSPYTKDKIPLLYRPYLGILQGTAISYDE